MFDKDDEETFDGMSHIGDVPPPLVNELIADCPLEALVGIKSDTLQPNLNGDNLEYKVPMLKNPVRGMQPVLDPPNAAFPEYGPVMKVVPLRNKNNDPFVWDMVSNFFKKFVT